MLHDKITKSFAALIFGVAILMTSLPSKADSLLGLLQDLESKRFLMGFDAQVREQLEVYKNDIDDYPQAVQIHYLLLYQDSLVRSGKLQLSIETRDKLLGMSKSGNVPPSYLLYSQMLLGLAYVNLSRGEESKAVLNDTIEESIKSKNYKIAFHSLLIFGDVFSSEKNFSKGFSSYQRAQSILKNELLSIESEQQSFARQAEMNYRIGYVYRHMWRDQESIEYFKKALYFDDKVGNKRNVTYDLNQIGNAYLRQGLFDKAEEHYLILEKKILTSGVVDESRMLDLSSSMLKLYIKSGNMGKAEKYLQIARSVEPEVQAVSIRIRFFLALAYYFNSVGMYEEAIVQCQEIETMASERNWAQYSHEVTELSAKAHFNVGQYKESSRLFERMHKTYLERSNHIRLMAAEVERARFDFESAALKVERLLQDNHIVALALESERSKLNVLVLIILLALLLIISLVSIVFFAMVNAKKLKVLADHDALTGVLNRRAILECGEERVNNTNKLSLLLVDVDYFKRVNDTYGHAKGDDVLKYITKIASSFCQPNVSFGRIGGEEFLFVIDSMEAIEALALGRKFSKKLKSQSVDGMPAPTVSIGHVFQENPDGADDLKTLLEKADEALYRAKSSGRDCIRQYDLSFSEETQSNSWKLDSSINTDIVAVKKATV